MHIYINITGHLKYLKNMQFTVYCKQSDIKYLLHKVKEKSKVLALFGLYLITAILHL